MTRSLVGLLGLLCSTACTAEITDEPDFEVEEVGAVQAELAVPVQKCRNEKCEIFKLSKGSWDLDLRAVSTHWCTLTAVSGFLEGESAIGVHHSTEYLTLNWFQLGLAGLTNDSGSMWRLAVVQQENGSLYGEAACTRRDRFKFDAGGETRISSFKEVIRKTSGHSSVDMSGGSWVSAVAGVRGEFDGGGEHVWVEQSRDTSERSTLHVRSGQGGPFFDVPSWIEGVGYSFFAGVAGTGHVPKQPWVGDGETGGGDDWSLFDMSTEASANAKSQQHVIKQLAPTSKAFCYLTSVSGDFDGGGERVRIYPHVLNGVENWMLEAKAEGGTAYAKASCIYYDQRTPDNDDVVR